MSAERDELRHAVRRAVETSTDPAALWRRLCHQVGVSALAIPEADGGAGGGLPELAAVGYELGRRLVPSPFLGSTVLAGRLLLALADEDARHRLLPGIGGGGTVAAVCWAGEDGGWSADRAALTAEAGTVTGTSSYVLDGAKADVLLAVASAGGTPAVLEVGTSEGVTREPTPALDGSRPLARVTFAGAPARRLAGDAAGALRQALDAALVVQAAENAGAARHCLEMTVAYAKQRVQFGRPIGSFQALKHRMADLYVAVEAAESAALAAADGAIAAATAASYCAEALATVTGETIQLHGGIAITWEHDAHRYFKRASAALQLLGGPAQHRAAVAAEVGL